MKVRYVCDGHVHFHRDEDGEVAGPLLEACQSDAYFCAFDSDGNHIGDFCDQHLAPGILMNTDAGGEFQGEDVTVRSFKAEGHSNDG